MKRKDKIKNLSLTILILGLIFLFLGLCSCNTQKQITLTDQKITYQIDTVIQIKEIPIEIESKPIEKIVIEYDTIQIETIRYKVKTYFDTVYKNIITKVESKKLEVPIKINKVIETKTKEKIKEKQPQIFKIILSICLICGFIYLSYLLY